MTPYRDNGHLIPAHKYFNKQLSSACVYSYIEHTFGILKQRFRQLYHVKLRGHERICRFIRGCCVLHNIGREEDLDLLNWDNDSPLEEQPTEQPSAIHSNLSAEIRNQLCQTMYSSRHHNE